MLIGCQPGNHWLPLQGIAGSSRLELMVAILRTRGYHCKELPVPKGWNSWFPTWDPEATIARNCRCPEVGTHASQLGNHRLPLQGSAGSQRLKLIVPNLKGHTLPVQGTADSQGLELMVRYRFVLFSELVAGRFVFLNGPVAESFAFG